MAVCSWLCKRPHAPDHSNVGVLWFADGVAGSVARLFLLPIVVSAFMETSSVWAAALEHCYREGSAPAGAIEGTEEQRRNAAGYRSTLSGTPILYRRACGLADNTDLTYIEDIVASTGCSLTSDYGLGQLAWVKLPLEDLEDLIGGQKFTEAMDQSPEFNEQLCSLAEKIPPPKLEGQTTFEQIRTLRVIRAIDELIMSVTDSQSSGTGD